RVVLTAVTGRMSTWDTSEYPAPVVSDHATTATAAVSVVAARTVRRRQAGTECARRSLDMISEAVDGRRANEPSGSGRCSSARFSAGRISDFLFATWASLKRSSARLVAAADDRFQHGEAGARVHERVGGGEHVAHPIGEAHHPQARLVAEVRHHRRA